MSQSTEDRKSRPLNRLVRRLANLLDDGIPYHLMWEPRKPPVPMSIYKTNQGQKHQTCKESGEKQNPADREIPRQQGGK